MKCVEGALGYSRVHEFPFQTSEILVYEEEDVHLTMKNFQVEIISQIARPAKQGISIGNTAMSKETARSST